MLALMSAGAHAANVFVRQGATGNGSGADWNNALTNIPSTPVRGNVYYIADGAYSFPYPLATPANGTQTIEFRKCSATDGISSVATGFQAAYCDGQATFNSVKLDTSYWIFNGAYRNELNWSQGSAYGFRIAGFETRSDFSGTDRVADHVTIKYVDIGPDDGNTNQQGYSGAVIYVGGFDRIGEKWTIQRNYIHNGRAIGQMAGTDGFLWEYNWIAKNWEKTGIRQQVRGTNMVYRYNVFKDTCQGNSFDATATSCTAILGWYGNGPGSESFFGSKVYGNLFIDTRGTVFYSDATIFMGDARSGYQDDCSNCEIFNNTFVGMAKYDPSSKVGFKFIGTTTGTAARNNIFYDVGSSTPFCQAAACSANPKITSASAFVGAASGNFHLSSSGAAGSGFVLGAPYDKDMDGVTRGIGVWDIGAFQFSQGVLLPPPANLRIAN